MTIHFTLLLLLYSKVYIQHYQLRGNRKKYWLFADTKNRTNGMLFHSQQYQHILTTASVNTKPHSQKPIYLEFKQLLMYRQPAQMSKTAQSRNWGRGQTDSEAVGMITASCL